jgi:hypothetical protein
VLGEFLVVVVVVQTCHRSCVLHKSRQQMLGWKQCNRLCSGLSSVLVSDHVLSSRIRSPCAAACAGS